MTGRRDFIKATALGAAGLAVGGLGESCAMPNKAKGPSMEFGLVTYMWGAEWDLPTLISTCEKVGLAAVELRTGHAHGVETTLSTAERSEVKKRFADSPVTCVGYGSNFEYHVPEPAKLRENIEQTKEYIKLCKDIGATGLKVKPNKLLAGVPKEQTIAQIATSLNEVGKFAGDLGMLVRVEAHGYSTEIPSNMKAIFDQVSEKSVNICWNCNPVDINPPGIEANFNMLKDWIGDVVHIHKLLQGEYPYMELFNLLAGNGFNGYLLLEDHRVPGDKMSALVQQLDTFNEMKSYINI
ncbi:MAG: TIM barrel protein [Bacteroidota bacterium]